MLEKLQAIQVVKISIDKHGTTQNATVHLALEDATDDSAILEYIGGKLVIHHGQQYRIMANATLSGSISSSSTSRLERP